MPDRRSRRRTENQIDGPLRGSADDAVVDRPTSAETVMSAAPDPSHSGEARPPGVTRWRVGGAGHLVTLLGAMGIFGSGFLHWLDVTVSRGSFEVTRTTTGTGVPVQFLWDASTRSHDPTVLAVLVPSAAVTVLGVVWRRARLGAVVAGLVAMGVGGLYAFQVNRTIDDIRSRLGGLVNPGLRDVLGMAPLVCFAGGALVVLGSLFALLRGADRRARLDWRWPGEGPAAD